MGHQICLAVGGVLHVPAIVHEVRRPNLDPPPALSGLAKKGGGRRTRGVDPGTAKIKRMAETHEGTKGTPVAAGAMEIIKGVGAVIPDAIQDQAAAWVAALIGRRIAIRGTKLMDLQTQRIITDDLGLSGR